QRADRPLEPVCSVPRKSRFPDHGLRRGGRRSFYLLFSIPFGYNQLSTCDIHPGPCLCGFPGIRSRRPAVLSRRLDPGEVGDHSGPGGVLGVLLAQLKVARLISAPPGTRSPLPGVVMTWRTKQFFLSDENDPCECGALPS